MESDRIQELYYGLTWYANSLAARHGSKLIIENINKHYFDNNIYIYNKLLNRVESYTFLGIYIHDKLTWKAHIDYICKRVSKFFAILHKLKFSLSIKSLKLL